MAQGFSKENQSSVATTYQFGEFELSPADRMLKRSGVSIPIQPKAFEALLCLVSRARHLVSKQELTERLWPSVHVSEANLTNTIVGLRKILGRDAIATVSKHGYRLELPVLGEPGVPRSTYEKFVRARELAAQRSLESMELARDLYWTCLAEEPGFAPAWAGLGRCCWFMDKFASRPSASAELAQAAFQRAFALDPDLASAHQFYTFVQVDTGRADDAMTRLLQRLKRHADEPESYVSLVHVLRFRGLLSESVAAHERAVELDPAVTTSVAHTLFLKGEYARAIETYGGRAGYYLDAAAWAALGEKKRAAVLLRERVRRMPLSRLMTALMESLLALLEERGGDAVRLMEGADVVREPEISAYFARHYAYLGMADRAMDAVLGAQASGFLLAPETLRSDPWLSGLREDARFGDLVSTTEAVVEEGRVNFGSGGSGLAV